MSIFYRSVTILLLQLQPRAISFEDQVSMIRQKLATACEKERLWSDAAQTLMGE